MRGANHAISAALHVAFLALICAFTNEAPPQMGRKKPINEIEIEFIVSKPSISRTSSESSSKNQNSKRRRTNLTADKQLATQNAKSKRIATKPQKIKKDINKDKKVISKVEKLEEELSTKSSSNSQNSIESNKDTTNNSQITTKRSSIKPACKRCIKPSYPRNALRRSQEGYVLIELTVTSLGRVSGARIIKSSGIESIDNAAIRAARKSTFISNNQTARFTIAYDLKISK